MDALPLGVMVTSAAHRALYVNTEYLKITGYRRLDIVGLENADRVLQRNVVGENEKVRTAFVNQSAYSGDHRYQKKDGSQFYCRIHVRPMFEHGALVQRMTTIQDITDEVTTRDALERKTNLYTNLLNTVPGFITHFEIKSIVEGRCVATQLQTLYHRLKGGDSTYKQDFKKWFVTKMLYGSSGSRELVGIDSDELCHDSGRWIFDTIHPDDQDVFYKRLFASASGNLPCRWSGRCRLDGQLKYVQLDSKAEIQKGGDTIHWYCSGLDVTQARTTERTLTSYVAHEVRNPLTSILGGVARLRAGFTSAAQQEETLRSIEECAQYMQRVTTDLLLCNKLEGECEAREAREASEGKVESTNVHALVASVVAMVRPSVEGGVVLRTEVDPTLVVGIDPFALKQILVNVVVNAIKHTRAGSVTASAAATGRELRVSIKDTGEGMDEEAAAKLFEKYWRAGRTPFASGLGMYLSMQLVKGMGGTIQVASAVGVGTEVTVSVPFSAPPKRRGGAGPASLASVRVLMVEDDAFVAEANIMVLTTVLPNVDVVVVRSGEEALARWRDGFRLITMDATLASNMSGSAAVEALREAGCALPIVSASTDEIKMDSTDGVWSKPWRVQTLRRDLLRFQPLFPVRDQLRE